MTTSTNHQRRINSLFLVPILAVFIASIEMFLPRAAQTPSIFYPCTNTQSQDNQSPPTIVLIPGLDGATSFFDEVIPLLTPHADVLMFHLPLRPTTMSEANYTFDYLSAELDKDIKAHLTVRQRKNQDTSSSGSGSGGSSGLLPSVHLVGESFGGVIAQWYVSQPSTQRAKQVPIDSLVLLSSLAKTELPPDIAWKADNLLPILKGVGSLCPGLAQHIFARLHVDDVCEPTEPQFVKDLFVKEASRADFRSVMSRIRLVRHLDIRQRSASIDIPTLIVYGADDHFTKASSLQLRELITLNQQLHGRTPSESSTSLLKSLPGGHLPHITSPRLFVEMILTHVTAITAATTTTTTTTTAAMPPQPPTPTVF